MKYIVTIIDKKIPFCPPMYCELPNLKEAERLSCKLKSYGYTVLSVDKKKERKQNGTCKFSHKFRVWSLGSSSLYVPNEQVFGRIK